jgi:hypothetical protein
LLDLLKKKFEDIVQAAAAAAQQAGAPRPGGNSSVGNGGGGADGDRHKHAGAAQKKHPAKRPVLHSHPINLEAFKPAPKPPVVRTTDKLWI